MKAVIRQEWKRRSSNTYTSSIVLAAVNLLALVLFYFDKGQGPVLPFLPKWVVANLFIPIVIVIDTLGFFIGVTFDNAANMKDMLYKDNGYLMKLLPISSWKLIGGKLITGMFELLFFGVQCAVYLAMFILISDGSITVDDANWMTGCQAFQVLLMVVLAIIIFWCFVNTFLNMVRTATSVITKRWKVPKAVIYIVGILIAWLTLKLTFTPLKSLVETLTAGKGIVEYGWSGAGVNKVFQTDLNLGWLTLFIETVISGIYYAITCVVYEKAVEV